MSGINSNPFRINLRYNKRNKPGIPLINVIFDGMYLYFTELFVHEFNSYNIERCIFYNCKILINSNALHFHHSGVTSKFSNNMFTKCKITVSGDRPLKLSLDLTQNNIFNNCEMIDYTGTDFLA